MTPGVFAFITAGVLRKFFWSISSSTMPSTDWKFRSGASGYRDVPTYCHAGPLASTVCASQGPVSLYINAVPKDW